MLYPVGTRLNHRYRGPVETEKMLRFGNDAEQNLKALFSEVEFLQESFEELRSNLGPSGLYKNHFLLSEVNRNIQHLEKEGQRHG